MRISIICDASGLRGSMDVLRVFRAFPANLDNVQRVRFSSVYGRFARSQTYANAPWCVRFKIRLQRISLDQMTWDASGIIGV